MNSEGRGLLPDSNAHTYTNIQFVMKMQVTERTTSGLEVNNNIIITVTALAEKSGKNNKIIESEKKIGNPTVFDL